MSTPLCAVCRLPTEDTDRLPFPLARVAHAPCVMKTEARMRAHERRIRHCQLHGKLVEIVAEYWRQGHPDLRQANVADLLEWSHRRTLPFFDDDEPR